MKKDNTSYAQTDMSNSIDSRNFCTGWKEIARRAYSRFLSDVISYLDFGYTAFSVQLNAKYCADIFEGDMKALDNVLQDDEWKDNIKTVIKMIRDSMNINNEWRLREKFYGICNFITDRLDYKDEDLK